MDQWVNLRTVIVPIYIGISYIYISSYGNETKLNFSVWMVFDVPFVVIDVTLQGSCSIFSLYWV